MKVTVTATGVDPATARVLQLGERARDPRPVFVSISRDLMADERRRFDSQGFGRWPALDADTIRRKSDRGQSPRILEAAGVLRRALTTPHAPGQRLSISRSEMVFGINQAGSAYYGRFHQAGQGVPKRLVLSVTARQRVTISERVRSFILHNR